MNSLSKSILIAASGLYILAAISELIIPNNCVFEVSRVTLPSIASFVIGYYFGTIKS